MRKVALAVLAMSALIFSSVPVSQAALNAQVNLDNPRVVPIFGQDGPSEVRLMAGWSGFLYSPRIVLSAAHSHYRFDNNGNRILIEPAFITVGKPNSSAKDAEGRAKVIKTFVADFTQMGNDFIVLVLDRDLVTVSPAKLMTAEIEAELVNARSEVVFHGYGEYRDRCAPGEKNPCKKDWNNLNQRTSELPRIVRMNLAPLSDSYFSWLTGNQRTELRETVISNPQGCPGDSGGPITTAYKGDLLYLGQGLAGANVYACGAGDAKSKENDPNSFGWFSPIYKHLDLLKEAEAFVAQQVTAKKSVTDKPAPSITCVKGKVTKKFSGPNTKCPKGYKKNTKNKFRRS
mgnify:CR=1 FL=1|jgi:hypothetical protein